MTTISSAPQKKIDPYAYLIRHGWSGTGNPLNPDRAGGTRGGLGLTKPILVARRSGNQGVGKKTTKDPTNQWWLRGFEDALKGVGTDAAAGGSTAGKANALTSELYRFFVRGEVIRGTLGDESKEGKSEGGEKTKTKKRKREGDDEGVRETKEERRKRKEEKRTRKAAKEARREARRVKKEEKKEKKAKKERKAIKALAKTRPEDNYPTPMSMDLDSADNGQGTEIPLDLEKLAKLKKKEKKEKKREKERKKEKSKKQDSSSSDESLKRNSKKSKTS
ncbi:hypothetical protein BJY00DRAFT_312908 [Aspergillus carlsbadensis]|nr:hypothetical protein BJY00DRAFT_312908 [Aspergillus carlsbadensis]